MSPFVIVSSPLTTMIPGTVSNEYMTTPGHLGVLIGTHGPRMYFEFRDKTGQQPPQYYKIDLLAVHPSLQTLRTGSPRTR